MLTCFFIYYLVIAHYSDITGLMLTKLKERLHLWICGQTDIEGNTLNFLRPEVLLQWFTCSFCSVLHPSLFPQLVHVLNMMSAKILTYAVSDDETVADLQLRLEKDTNIPAADQELLLEAGLALEPQGLATQCAIDYTVISKHQYCTHTIPSQNSQQSNVIMDWVTVFIIISICRRLMGDAQTCLWSSCFIVPLAVMNLSLLLALFQKTSASSVSTQQ